MALAKGNSNAVILPEKLSSPNKGNKQFKVKQIGGMGKAKQASLSILPISLTLTWAHLLCYPQPDQSADMPWGISSPDRLNWRLSVSEISRQHNEFVHYSILRCTLLIGGLCSALLKEENPLTHLKYKLFLKGQRGDAAPWQQWHHGNSDSQ